MVTRTLLRAILFVILALLTDGKKTRTYDWHVTLLEDDKTTVVKTVDANENYYLCVQVKPAVSSTFSYQDMQQTGTSGLNIDEILATASNNASDVDIAFTRELAGLGEVPQFEYHDQEGIYGQSLNRSWEMNADAFDYDRAMWIVPFKSYLPSIIELRILSHGVGLPGFSVRETAVTISVLPEYFAILSNEGNIPSNVTKDIATPLKLQLSYVPGCSLVWFVHFTTTQNENLILGWTTEQFETYDYLDLVNVIPPVLKDLTCTTSQSPSLGAISLPHRVVTNTQYGVFVSQIVNGQPLLIRGVDECVSSISVPTQSHPFNSTFNDVVFAFVNAPRNTSAGPTVYVSKNSDQVIFDEVRDYYGKNFADFYRDTFDMADTELLFGAVSVIDPTTYFFLARTANFYHLIRFYAGPALLIPQYMKPAAWSSTPHYSFPKLINNANSSLESSYRLTSRTTESSGKVTFTSTSDSDTLPLTITGMGFASIFGTDLFMWGSALLYSADSGSTVYVLRAFPNSPVSTFTTSHDGSFALMLENLEVWFGNTGSPITVQVYQARAVQEGSSGSGSVLFAASLFFDAKNNLYELFAIQKDDSEPPVLYRSDTLLYESPVLIQEASLQYYHICPYATADFSASHEPVMTRILPPEGQLVISDRLPARVFLDMGQTYSFTLQLTANPPLGLNDLEASIWLSANRSVSASISRYVTSYYTGFQVDLRELSIPRPQYPPGEDMQAAFLRVIVHNTTLACQDETKSNSIQTTTSFNLELYVGCPPYQQPVFDSALSHTEFIARDLSEEDPDPVNDQWKDTSNGYDDLCVDENLQKCGDCCERKKTSSGEMRCTWTAVREGTCIPSFYFGFDFHPRFVIMDDVTGDYLNYTGNYMLDVVGAGPSPDDITAFSEDEVNDYNYKLCSGCGLKLIFAIVNADGDTEYMTECGDSCRSALGCDCRQNALVTWVCSAGSPCNVVFPKWPKPPEFFFNLTFYTDGANDTSYCNMRTSFLIKVHGIPMSLDTMLTITFASLGTWFTVLAAGYPIYKFRQNRLLAQIAAMEEEDDDETASVSSRSTPSRRSTNKSFRRAGKHRAHRTDSRNRDNSDSEDSSRPSSSRRSTRPTSREGSER
eukprot:TRINITY_DN24_c0_g1::TRINITY_DN24_c0_g1_i1::g.14904::m.14904 TRINITY_DN24_c0_g1::TRINITY_DN24_c0_g1_i1::g.14904  ORF type:complete len:1115 (+),score=216.50,sp/Q4R6B2/CTSRG_MACFA/23.46/4e-21,CATSPERG/PF15064.1/0.012,CATSPERG/PF15064.1/0.0023,Golgin_A5/PF09787.4/1.9 TRINITY_DN24_c0_g1_i1:116-3460(+)